MTGKGDKSSITDGLQYPMVDLFTGGTMLPLMFVKAAATCYLIAQCTAGTHAGMDKSA
jgi:hypothetical protein